MKRPFRCVYFSITQYIFLIKIGIRFYVISKWLLKWYGAVVLIFSFLFNRPVKRWLSRYISKYRVFESRIVTGLFVTRLVADEVWRFYNGSQSIRDVNFDSCALGALGACDLCSYKHYFDGRIFRPENYRGHLFSRASDLLLILLLLHHHRCKELYIISWFFHLCSVIPYYFIRLRKLREEIADALRIHCKTKVRFSEYFEYLSMEWKSKKSTIYTMIRELIRCND